MRDKNAKLKKAMEKRIRAIKSPLRDLADKDLKESLEFLRICFKGGLFMLEKED